MSMSNTAETALLNLLFANTDWANVGDAGGLGGSTADGSFFISLHTGDPGEAGDQTTSECDYTSYARVAVARTGAAWTVSGSNASNAAAVTFPQATGGTNTGVTGHGAGRHATPRADGCHRICVDGIALI
jgi:hypothetical protein